MPSTARMGLPYYQATDPPAGHTQQQALATALDSTAAMFLHGTLSGRPTSSPSTPGKAGRLYYATDNGQVYYDTGTGWVQLTATASVEDGPPNVATLRSLGTGANQAAAGNDGRLTNQRVPVDGSATYVKLGSDVKPSAGAGASSEALRALGTQPGRAAPGVHASQHAVGGADPLPNGAVSPAMLAAAPYVRVARYTNQTVGVGAGDMDVPLAFNVEEVDTASMWSSGSPNVLSVPYAGQYVLTIQAFVHSPNPGGNRGGIYIAGGTNYDPTEINASTPPIPNDGLELGINACGVVRFTSAGSISLNAFAASGTYTIGRMFATLAFVSK